MGRLKDIGLMWRMIAIGVVSAVLFAPGEVWPKDSWDNPPKGRVSGLKHGTFQSASMQVKVGYNICLPPEYSDQKKRFPVIYYLHGYQGNESSYLDYEKYWRGTPTLLVFVNGGETSFFCDAPDGSVMGETIVKELVAHIDQTYRTIAERKGRALHGYSMGGYGALKLGFKYPEMFGCVVAYGATLSSAQETRKHLGKVYAKMFGGREERFEANNPLKLLERNADKIRSGTRVLLVIGSKDEFLPANRQLYEQLKRAGVPAKFEEVPGGKHSKESIYEKAAPRAFTFTLESLGTR